MLSGKKGWVMLLAAAMVCSSLAGCSTENKGTEGGATATQEAATSKPTEAAEPEQPYLASTEPLEAKIHMHYWDGVGVFDDNLSVFKRAAELTNVTLKGTASATATKSEELFNLMIASNEVPDIVHWFVGGLNEYGMEGAFEPLDDLINEHAPNIKKYLEDHPNIRKAALAPDGKLYYVPNINDGEAAQGWFIRTDWLEKLDLAKPNNAEEFYQVLKAFKEKDPNGNNKADEIPYFTREPMPYDLLILWDSYFDYIIRDGKIAYGPYEPQFKEAMINLAKWYKEGLIDQEVFTRGAKAREVLLGDNIGGSTHDWFASTAGFNSISETVEGLKFEPIAPPADQNGQRVERTGRLPYGVFGWSISAESKHKVELIKYFDFWFTEEGNRLMNYGIEGETYTMVDGKPQLKEELLQKNTLEEVEKIGARKTIGYQADFEMEKQWTNPIALAGINEYIDNGYVTEQLPPFPYTEEEKKVEDELKIVIETYVKETMQKWIFGSESIEDNFDSFQAQLKKLGVDQLLKVRQDAYDRFKS